MAEMTFFKLKLFLIKFFSDFYKDPHYFSSISSCLCTFIIDNKTLSIIQIVDTLVIVSDSPITCISLFYSVCE